MRVDVEAKESPDGWQYTVSVGDDIVARGLLCGEHVPTDAEGLRLCLLGCAATDLVDLCRVGRKHSTPVPA